MLALLLWLLALTPREAQGVAPDWRPGDLMPEDYWAR